VIKITPRTDGVSFALRVQPRASKSAVTGELDGALKISLAAPPVEGEANEELIRFLAKVFAVSRSQITLISGQRSKNKIVRVSGVSIEVCEKILAEALRV
jgi:hypothetical protein